MNKQKNSVIVVLLGAALLVHGKIRVDEVAIARPVTNRPVVREPEQAKKPKVERFATPGPIAWVPFAQWREARDRTEPKRIVWLSFEQKQGCPPCEVVKRDVYTNNEVRSYANANFVCVRITEDLVAELWGIDGYPTSVFLGQNNRFIRVEGKYRPDTPTHPKLMMDLFAKANSRSIVKSPEERKPQE